MSKNISNGVKNLEVNKKIIVKKIKLVEKHLKRLKEFKGGFNFTLFFYLYYLFIYEMNLG